MIYGGFSTKNDVFKEILIQGAELTEKHNFPVLPAVSAKVHETVSFSASFKKTNSVRENLHFFEHDMCFTSLWNSPFKYLDHLKEYDTVCMPDYTMAVDAPYPQNLYNEYKNRALAYWMTQEGITVIPNVPIMPESFWGWIWEGLPKHSTLCCCANGKSRAGRLRSEFCEQFCEMCDRLEPDRVLIYGKVMEELDADCEIVYVALDNAKSAKDFKSPMMEKEL